MTIAKQEAASRSETNTPALVLFFAASILLVLASFTTLHSTGNTLRSMATFPCADGEPLDLQVFGATPDEVREIVTGWHRFTLISEGAVEFVRDGASICTSFVPVQGATAPFIGTTYSALKTVQWWIMADTVLVVPAYVVALILGILMLSRSQWPANSPLHPLLKMARDAIEWRHIRAATVVLVLAGAAMDLLENRLLCVQLERWWAELTGTGALLGDLELEIVRFVGGVKFALLMPPALVLVLVVAGYATSGALSFVRALSRMWVQAAVTVVFAVAVLLPAQSADALRRMSPSQWLGMMFILTCFAMVVAIGASDRLDPGRRVPAASAR